MGVLCNCVQKADLDLPMHGIQAIFSVCSYHKYVIVTLPWLKKKKSTPSRNWMRRSYVKR